MFQIRRTTDGACNGYIDTGIRLVQDVTVEHSDECTECNLLSCYNASKSGKTKRRDDVRTKSDCNCGPTETGNRCKLHSEKCTAPPCGYSSDDEKSKNFVEKSTVLGREPSRNNRSACYSGMCCVFGPDGKPSTIRGRNKDDRPASCDEMSNSYQHRNLTYDQLKSYFNIPNDGGGKEHTNSNNYGNVANSHRINFASDNKTGYMETSKGGKNFRDGVSSDYADIYERYSPFNENATVYQPNSTGGRSAHVGQISTAYQRTNEDKLPSYANSLDWCLQATGLKSKTPDVRRGISPRRVTNTFQQR